MNRLILAVTAVGVSALAVYAVTTAEDDEEIPEASVTQRSTDPAPVLIALPQTVNAKKAMPTDFPSLAREIQRELRRVGCYRGEINSRWTPATRAAMKAYVDDANARLPVDAPDQVLLSLLQGERGTACNTCPAGQSASPDGTCASTTVASSGSATVTGSIDRLAPATNEESSQENDRLAAAPAAPTREEAQRDEPTPDPPVDQAAPYVAPDDPPAREPLETAALAEPPPPSAEEAALMPPAAVPQQTKKRARYSNRPPKIVRKMIRNIQRGLASFGIR